MKDQKKKILLSAVKKAGKGSSTKGAKKLESSAMDMKSDSAMSKYPNLLK